MDPKRPLFRLQLTDNGRPFCCVDLIEGSTGKARHERRRRRQLPPAAAGNSLIEKVLTRRTRLRRTDAEIIGSSALDLNLGFIVAREEAVRP